jgi:hypothetical protein
MYRQTPAKSVPATKKAAKTAAASAEGCMLSDVDWCAAQIASANDPAKRGTIRLKNPKATLAFGTSAGLHNECWEKLPTASVGLIRNGRNSLVYDKVTKTYQIKQEGCGDGARRLCAFAVAVKDWSTNLRWLRDDQPEAPVSGKPSTDPQSGAVSCSWKIVPATGGLNIQVPADSTVTSMRNWYVGFDLSKDWYWNKSVSDGYDGKPYYVPLNLRATASDETLFVLEA